MNYLAAGLFCIVWGVIIASTGKPLIFIDAVSLLAVSAGAACFALAAEEGQRLVRLGRGGLLTGWVAFFVGLVLIADSFPPTELSLLGKQLAVLFLGPLYGFGLFSITKLLSKCSMKSSEG